MRMRKETSMQSVRALLVVAAFTIAPSYVLAGDVRIIANAGVKADAISAADLRSVFLKERRALRDGSRVEPVFEKSGAAHDAFLKAYLDMNNAGLQSYYGALVFTGKASMPKAFNSDAEVASYVARTNGAIGYVSSTTGFEGVKILAVVTEESKAPRALLTRIEPEYPATLRGLQIGGTVRLAVTISPQGRVEAVALLGGNPILGEAAEKAVKQWVYAPAVSRTTIEVTIPFEPGR